MSKRPDLSYKCKTEMPASYKEPVRATFAKNSGGVAKIKKKIQTKPDAVIKLKKDIIKKEPIESLFLECNDSSANIVGQDVVLKIKSNTLDVNIGNDQDGYNLINLEIIDQQVMDQESKYNASIDTGYIGKSKINFNICCTANDTFKTITINNNIVRLTDIADSTDIVHVYEDDAMLSGFKLSEEYIPDQDMYFPIIYQNISDGNLNHFTGYMMIRGNNANDPNDPVDDTVPVIDNKDFISGSISFHTTKLQSFNNMYSNDTTLLSNNNTYCIFKN
jgi:hypothetical protein